MILEHARGRIETDRCLVMGILNRTPDSFYDGGRMDLRDSVAHAESLVAQGADLLDVGAVKAGPGPAVPEDVELDRLLPLLQSLAREDGVPLSVETSRSGVARAALAEGAALVNDVSALADPGLAPACAEGGAGLIVMHHGGQIRGRPRHPRYDDVVASVAGELTDLASMAERAGLHRDQLVIDPGLDFGKTTFHSLELMRRLEELTALPWPVLVAPSRKDVVGETLDLDLDDRLEGTLALVALAVMKGASIVRVHDVRAATRVVAMVEAVAGKRPPANPIRGLWD
ncbi:MAG: dihydropteroate synthase [Actinomycetota bacterium]|nr:dihydropteroate synthase [Actinomycetota bacterium]